MNANAPLFTPKVSSFDPKSKDIVIEYLKNGYISFYYRASQDVQEDKDVQSAYILEKIKERDKELKGTFEATIPLEQLNAILPTNLRNNNTTIELAQKLIKYYTITKLEKRKQSYFDVNSALDAKISSLARELQNCKDDKVPTSKEH